MSTKLKELKSELKVLASQIREGKAFFKDCQRGTKNWTDYYQWERTNSYPSSHKARHMHIAYCLLRGRTYEQIENKVRENNEPNMSLVEQIMAKYREVEPISCGDSVVA